MRTDPQQGILLDVIVGIIGVLIGGFLIAPMFGTDTINRGDFSLSGLATPLLGAVILLATLKQRREIGQVMAGIAFESATLWISIVCVASTLARRKSSSVRTT
jgi:uncharacterized membrane protein YeaQ/YmgE (transglycosylase-associated protein family)